MGLLVMGGIVGVDGTDGPGYGIPHFRPSVRVRQPLLVGRLGDRPQEQLLIFQRLLFFALSGALRLV